MGEPILTATITDENGSIELELRYDTDNRWRWFIAESNHDTGVSGRTVHEAIEHAATAWSGWELDWADEELAGELLNPCITDAEGACKRLSSLEYEVVGAPRKADEMLGALTHRAEIILADAADQKAGNIEAAQTWLLASDEERQEAVKDELAGWELAEELAEELADAERDH